ncbi:MAG: hypothetical protein K6G33_07325 [Ruminococcus sp.]|uniref:hypothetical protein n=1 Tax=Ruminococcus sp. TaxID=41978 RepID=UPI0025D18E87|nr:hypothetical protein [Ruminococcus sp.]MCR5600533.1 hypothetical protein [Ruminococcus sp.]
MKMNNIFDILENAEDDSMERLTDKCPEITDAQLDRILAMSEKKYKTRKKEITGNKKDNNIKMTENSDVSGVEHSKRPTWAVTLRIAASLVLVAGVAIGSTVMLRRNSGIVNDGGKIPPAATATTTEGSGTTHVTTNSSGTTIKNGTTDKNGSTITTVVTAVSTAKDANKQQSGGTGTSGGGAAVSSESVKAYAGKWQYQIATNGLVDVSSRDNGTVIVNEDGTYSYTDTNGYTSSGKVEISTEEIGGTRLTTVNFYVGGVYQFGGYYDDSKPYEINIGNGGTARLVRGDDIIKRCEYQNTAYELVEKYYKMMPIIKFRFHGYLDLNDSVTFKIANPYSNGQIEDVTFARISGNGFEFDSIEDIMAYRRTVYSESLAKRELVPKYKTIDDSYNSGDQIPEADPYSEDGLYYQSFIIYRGHLYANTVSPAMGWLGHVEPREPIVITDITSNSFRAYYPSLTGEFVTEPYTGCDIVDFVLDPSCGEWRMNSLTIADYSVYQSKAAEAKY